MSLFLCSGACSSDDDGTESFAATDPDPEYQRLFECGLLSDGALNTPMSTTGVAQCRDECFVAASCVELSDFWCGRVESPSLTECIGACSLARYHCDEGTVVGMNDVCDGIDHCPDASDEKGCSLFQCGSGERIPPRDRCDGGEHCADGSDELNCPTFTCNNGQQVLATERCDLRTDCRDNSDEAGCARLLCPAR